MNYSIQNNWLIAKSVEYLNVLDALMYNHIYVMITNNNSKHFQIRPTSSTLVLKEFSKYYQIYSDNN